MRAIDPIDRIALMEKLGIGKECTVCEQNSDPYCKWKPDVVDVCEAICTAPSIEPEIVRCKDCVYAADDDYHHCSYVTWWNGENDFCSRAERRTDGV